MNQEEIQAFLAEPNDAIIAVNRLGKGAQLTPVWFWWDGEAFYISTETGTAKYRNMQKDANISLIVNNTATSTFVTAEGPAEILEGAKVDGSIVSSILAKYLPPEERAPFEAMIKANAATRVLVVLHPTKILGTHIPD